ncbi:MAG TPA: response regulator [Sphingomonas sp.]|nr:response regulator [Sphingomonas sp.]
MTTKAPAPKRILLVEDEYLIADDMAYELRNFGLEVIGPFPSVAATLKALETTCVDGAVLDINLSGEKVYPVADVLLGRDVPMIFTTGYDNGEIPPRYAAIDRCSKPVTRDALAKAVDRLVSSEEEEAQGRTY